MADLPDFFSLFIAKGWDGTEYRTMAVDNAGRAIMVPRGQSGYYLAVDANGYLTVKARGVDAGSVERDLLVDSQGRIIAMLKAMFDTTPTDLMCDALGNITINLKAQGLAELINRPKYGHAAYSKNPVGISQDTEYTFVTISGKGVIYGGYIISGDADILGGDIPRLYVDGDILHDFDLDFMNTYHLYDPTASPLYLVTYDTTGPHYAIGLQSMITFETSVSLRYLAEDAATRTMWYLLVYATV